MHDAKSQLSRYVREIQSGAESEVIIAIAGRPVARLLPYGSAQKRTLGFDKGLVRIAEDFDSCDAQLQALFEGE